MKSGAGKTPNVDALAGGPAFLGYPGIMVSPRQDDATDQGEGNTDDLRYFIAKYFVANQGLQKIKKRTKEDKRYSDADIDDDDAGAIWLPGDEEFDSVDNVPNNVGEDDDNEGNEDGSRGREENDDDSDASSSIEEMRNGGVNGRGDRESRKRRRTGV